MGEKHQFPTIHIHPIFEETEVTGKGTIASVSCVAYESQFSINGQFRVSLNRYQLDAPTENGADAVSWGAVIVHEMLHNLGHTHAINDYTDHCQINVYEKCFLYNGNY